MCSILGIIGKSDENEICTMLKTLEHRGPNAKGIYSNNTVYYNDDIKNINFNSSDIVLAHNLLSIVGSTELQPLMEDNFVLIANAEIYNYDELINQFSLSDFKTNSDCEIILKLIKMNYTDDLMQAVRKTIDLLDGDYAFSIYDGKNYVLVRDAIGVKPLYYSNEDNRMVFASEQKALRKININTINNLNPRYVIHNNKIIKIRNEYQHKEEYSDYNKAKNDLKKAITESVRKRTKNLDKVALLFSAGVDSTIIAVLLKQLGVDTTLYTVGTENSQDLQQAIKTAHDINLPIKTRIITQKDVEDNFYNTINAIEDTNLMKIGVGMTINLTSQLASNDEHKVILSGQGADELFAGYNRYKNRYDNKKELLDELSYDINNMYHVNLERDDKATMNNSIELRVPFLDKKVINTALKIPIKYLLHSNEDNIRKHILRDIAHDINVPNDVAYRPKKAAQYGTGIDKIIRKKLMKNEKYNRILSK